MKISLLFEKPNIFFKKILETKEPTAIITNKRGGFLNLSKKIKNANEGFFFSDKNFDVFKIIEEIKPKNKGTVKEIQNNFYQIKKFNSNLEETFFLPDSFNSLVYKTSNETKVEVYFDFRRLFEAPVLGGEYKIYEENKCIIVEFTQKKDFQIYLAIKTKHLDYKKLNEWIKRTYSKKERAQTNPISSRKIFKGLSIKGKEFVFSVSKEKNKAIEESKEVFSKIEKLKHLKKNRIVKILKDDLLKKIKNKNTKFAYVCAKNSLFSLLNFTESKIENRYRLFAGLPNLAQINEREEFFSLKTLYSNKLLSLPQTKILILDALKNIADLKNKKINTQNLDSCGWLFKRIDDFVKIKKFNALEKKEIAKSIKKIINIFEKKYIKKGLLKTKTTDTWMATQERCSTPIENQALLVSMYNLAHKLTKKYEYKESKEELLERIRLYFLDDKKNMLADCKDDFTIRPNIFLAYYIYPEMLEKNEWKAIFENAIKHLWLNWGGFSTISKKDKKFKRNHIKEDGESLYNGDSWFFINNIVALSLYQIDKKKFGKYINKIIETNTKDILEYGAFGHSSEFSSASKFDTSFGSPVCALSAVTYIELIEEVFS